MRKRTTLTTDPDGLQVRQRLGCQSAFLVLLTAALWGANPVAVRYSVDTLPPLAVAAIRFAMATVFMGFWCRWEGSRLGLAAGQRLPAFLAGFGLFVQISLFNVGVMLSNSSHGTMLINTFIFWVAVLEHFVTRGDQLTRGKLAGLLTAAAGVALVLWSSDAGTASGAAATDRPTLWGDSILLLSAAVLAVKILYVKHALRRIEPGKLIFWHNAIGTVLFAALSLPLETVRLDGFTFPATLALLYQGLLVAGLCFAIQAVLLRRHTASQISVFSFAAPLFGVTLAVALRGDSLSPWLLLAAACVAWGIWKVNRRS